MSEKDIENVEIEALNDDELEAVAGGFAESMDTEIHVKSESCCCTTGGSNCSN
jgi:hypothetical protein